MSTSGPLQHNQIPQDGFTPSAEPHDLEKVWKFKICRWYHHRRSIFYALKITPEFAVREQTSWGF